VPAAAASTPKGNVVAGKKIFVASCGTCHTLKAAGTVAKSRRRGPSFVFRLTFAKVFRQLFEGGDTMPSFADKLTSTQIRDVAAFVEQATKTYPKSGY
jgi:mono/diheme cytochrome c family protein